MRQFYVYIMASHSKTLYVGVTNDLERRVHQHKSHWSLGFSSRYAATHLVYLEASASVAAVIAREKQIKCWRRERKIRLIESENPEWLDLAAGWDSSSKG